MNLLKIIHARVVCGALILTAVAAWCLYSTSHWAISPCTSHAVYRYKPTKDGLRELFQKTNGFLADCHGSGEKEVYVAWRDVK